MKNKMKLFYSILLLVAVLFSSVRQVFGQEKVNITAGVGFIEVLNFGVRYQIDHSQIGLSIGTWPFPIYWKDYKNAISLSGDFYYHFGGASKLSDLPVWYGRIGLDYFRIYWESGTENNLDSHLRIGRDFYFSRHLGISLDAGVGFFIINESDNNSWLPNLGGSIFYRF
jgi:hypothetical protein